MSYENWDVIVVGGGIAGLTATIMCQQLNLKTICIDSQTEEIMNKNIAMDLRSTAYLLKSIQLFKELQIWNKLRESGEELKVMTIRGTQKTTRNILSLANFKATELGKPYLAHNIPNRITKDILISTIREGNGEGIRFGVSVVGLTSQLDNSIVSLSDKTQISAKLVIAADGRNSTVRSISNIALKKWDHGQNAIAFEVIHQIPHNGESIEMLEEGGPCTFVPIRSTSPGSFRSAVVWMETRKRVNDLMSMDDKEFAKVLTKRVDNIFGTIQICSQRRSYPIISQLANKFCCTRLALIGESAHVMPPIGAQGLNSSLEDIDLLAKLIQGVLKKNKDIGSEELLKKYNKMRRTIILPRMLGIELLNQTSRSKSKIVHNWRNFGLRLINNNSSIKKTLMKVGLGERPF